MEFWKTEKGKEAAKRYRENKKLQHSTRKETINKPVVGTIIIHKETGIEWKIVMIKKDVISITNESTAKAIKLSTMKRNYTVKQ